ncbi:KxYKxGKxW signal peptide domain-containing protein (plasmid) [Lentilactobacillus parabuchneri]|uniref:mucin-binding protein n=1 Tax=Lentilactobacillus parabuchneri TaxID=152331 RepID=UPI001869591F|nr:MucBP domain-containing protein [Lentilactobacillus parabuchneri]QOP51813.1 KxYKxGKxW signal peptide domain-containing protein [Lentilactobacillus parabuchneri]
MGEKKLHYKMYKDGKKFVFAAIATLSFFVFGGVSTVAVHADTTSGNLTAATVNSTSDTKSAVSSVATVASSSSAVKADSTGASSSAVKADSTGASSSAVKADSTGASSSAVKADSTGASSSAVKADSTGASSSAVKADSTGASSSAVKADSTNASSSSAAKSYVASTTTPIKNNKISGIQSQNSISQFNKDETVSGKVTVNKDNFDNYFHQNGSANNKYDKNTGIQTITDGSFQSGNVAFDGAIDVRNNFEIDGAINLGQTTSSQGYTGIADGIGFVFYKGDRNQVGGNGGNLGIYGVTDAFGWKVDTWFNDSKFTNSTQILKGDYDDGHTNPYGTFITTDSNGYGTIDQNSAKNLTQAIDDNQFHDVKFIYTAATKEFKIILSTPDGDVTFSKTFDYDVENPAYYFTIASSTGVLPTHQAFRIDSMTYSPIQKAIINYIDDTTRKTIATDSVTGNGGTAIQYSTSDSISKYTSQGYVLVSNGFVPGTNYDTDDTVDQVFNVHLVHGVSTTDAVKTVKEIIHYQGAGDSTPADKVNEVTFNGKKFTDNVTGEQTYGDWSADQSFDAVVSPDVKGYTADPSQIGAQTVSGSSDDLSYTVNYTKQAPTKTTDSKTVKETIHYQGAGDSTPADKVTEVTFTRDVFTDAVTGEKTYGAWSADQSFDAVVSPDVKGYTADPSQIGAQTVSGSSDDLSYTVNYTKQAPTKTTDSKTVKETIHYQGAGDSTPADKVTEVTFTRDVFTDAVTGEKTYGAWSADQSFDAVTSPELKGYTADKAQIDKQTVNGDSKDLEFTVTYTKNAPTMTTEKKTVNETVSYVDQNGNVLAQPHTASVDFTRQVSTDAVTGEKTYGAWSADQSFDAVTSPELKGYTADKAQIDKQTVNGDSKDLEFTVTYTKNAPTMTTEKKTVNETVSYVDQNGNVLAQPHTASVDFTRQVSTDAVTGEKTYGAWSADQSFDAVTSPELKGYTADKAQIDKQTVNGDSKDLEFTVTYTKNAPTMTTEKKTVNETVSYVDQNGNVLAQPHTASVDFTRQVSTDAVTGEKTYGAWSADQSFDAVTSPELKGYTADKAQIDKQTVNGDSKDLEFTVTYTKNAPTMTTEKKTVNETVSYVDQNGNVLAQPHTASVDFTRQVSTDAVTGEKTYGAWSADQSFDAVTSPELKGYTADKAQIDKQTVNGDSKDLEFTVTYTKNAPTMTTEKKTVNETVSYVDQNGNVLAQPHTASVDFTRQVSTDAVTGEKTYGAWSADQSFDAVTSPELKGYTADKAQIDKQTVNGDSKDLEFTVTYTKNAPTMTTEKKTVNETVSYVDQNGNVLAQPHTASVDFTRQVSTDAVTGEKTYGAWSADQSFDAVTSPELKGYTADKAQIDKQTVNGDSKDLEFTVTYTKNAPTMTTEKKTVNETVSYVDQNGNVLAQPHTASVDFTRQVSTDAVTGEKTYGAWSADQSFDAVTSPELKGYTADKAQIDKQTVNGDSKDLEFTVTYTKNAPTMTTEKKTVNETVSYVDQNGNVLAQPHTASVDFTRQVSTDAVTGEKTYGAWSADQSFDAVTSPELKGYTADKAQIDKQTVNGDSKDLEFTVTYTKNAPTMTTEKKTVNETVSYVDQNGNVLAQPHTASVDFTRQVSTDAVTGEKTYGAWSADQSFDAVISPELKGYTADKAQIDKQTVNGDSKDLEFTVTYTKNAPTMTTEKKTVNETVSYVDQNGNVLAQPHTASVDFTRQVSTDAVTGEKTYGAWSADQSFDAVTSPELKGYTADKAQIDKQTVNGDSKDLEFTVTYTKNAPTMTTEKKTVNETVSYVDQNGNVLAQPHTASVDFTRQVSTDAVTGEKTYGAWSADQSFDAVTSPELKGYTADKAQIDKQTVNGDSKDLEFTVTYTKNAPTMTTEKKTVNETVSYVDQNGNVLAQPHTASVDFTRQVSTDAVTGEKTYGAWSADQSFDAVTSPELKGYTADKAQIDKQTVNEDSKDLEFTVTYTKTPGNDTDTGNPSSNQPGNPSQPSNGTDTGNPSSNQPGNPSQPSNATKNGVINTSTNTGSKVNNGAVNSPELPQTGENNSQSQTMSFIGILLAMFGSLLGFLGIKKRRND